MEYDPDYTSALLTLGKILKVRGDSEGDVLLQSALIQLQDDLYSSTPTIRKCEDLIQVCNTLDGYEELKSSATDIKKRIINTNKELYSLENLVSSLKPNLGMKES